MSQQVYSAISTGNAQASGFDVFFVMGQSNANGAGLDMQNISGNAGSIGSGNSAIVMQGFRATGISQYGNTEAPANANNLIPKVFWGQIDPQLDYNHPRVFVLPISANDTNQSSSTYNPVWAVEPINRFGAYNNGFLASGWRRV